MAKYSINLESLFEKTTEIHSFLGDYRLHTKTQEQNDDLLYVRRRMNNIRRRFSILIDKVSENQLDDSLRFFIYERSAKEFDYYYRKINPFFRVTDPDDMYNSIIAQKDYIEYFETFIREFTQEVLTYEKSNREKLIKSVEMEEIYSKTKYISDEITKEFEKLSFFTSKIKEQQQRIDELEENYRKALHKFSFEEEAFKNKMSLVDKSFSLANDFIKKSNVAQQFLSEIDVSYNSINTKVNELDTTVQYIESSLEEKNIEINTIISQANSALGSATTVSLGGHFKEQYEKSQKGAWWWAAIGAAFLIGAIILCITTVFPSAAVMDSKSTPNNFELHYIISRLLISPLFLVGAWFCANQYVKQKNIIEDYAYKKVLSLSLLSIKAEIEKTNKDNAAEFIRAVQKEIMKSPLDSLDRKHFNKEMKLLKMVHSEAIKNIIANVSGVTKKKNAKEAESKESTIPL